MASDFRKRVELHGWAALGYGGMYCGVVVGNTLSQQGRLAALGMGVLGVIATLKAFLSMGPTPVLRENMLAFWQWLSEARLGLKAALVTVGLTASTLTAAALIATPDSDARIGAADGLRMAIYLMLFAYVWRLQKRWRILAIVMWALFDLVAAAASGGMRETPVHGNALLTLVIGIPMTWLLLTAQDALDPDRATLHG